MDVRRQASVLLEVKGGADGRVCAAHRGLQRRVCQSLVGMRDRAKEQDRLPLLERGLENNL